MSTVTAGGARAPLGHTVLHVHADADGLTHRQLR
jgi:hypothetical protein